MPTYEYACTACGERLEVVQSFTDSSLTECPACAGRLRKVFSPVGVVFKGSGFYKTDSRTAAKNGNGSSADSKSSDKADSAASPDAKSSDAKKDAPKSDAGSTSSSSPGSGGSSTSGGSSSGSSPGTKPAAKPAAAAS